LAVAAFSLLDSCTDFHNRKSDSDAASGPAARELIVRNPVQPELA
jgi:hypothetical protein